MSFNKNAKSSDHMPVEALHVPQTDAWKIFNTKNIKVASIDKLKDGLGGFDLATAVSEHPDHLFVKVFAIKANEVNDNGDLFSTDELKKAAHTFVGVPVFVNHENDDVEKARGKVMHAWFDVEKDGIYTINMVDRKAYPKLARGIEQNYVTGTSMGAQVGYSLCSVCHNRAATADEFCSHVRERKNKKFSGKHDCEYHKSDCEPTDACPLCASTKEKSNKLAHKDTQIFEYNYDIKFIEDSFVVNPACHDCLVCDVLNVPEVESRFAAVTEHIQDALTKISKHDDVLMKEAGQDEIASLNSAMNEIERVARSMMAQKQQVSLEYVSDIVDVLAKIQDVTDELIEMGYPQLPSPSPEEIALGNSAPASPADQATAQQFTDPNAVQTTPQPMLQQTAQPSSGGFSDLGGGIGSVTKPSFSSLDDKNKKEFIEKISKINRTAADAINSLRNIEAIANSGGDKQTDGLKCVASVADGNRRIIVSSDDVGDIIVGEFDNGRVLSFTNSDKFDEDTRKLLAINPKEAAKLILERTLKESEIKMAKNENENSQEKTAAGKGVEESQTEMITEKQLSSQTTTPYTERQEEFYEGITQSAEQLGRSDDQYKDTTLESPQKRLGTYEFITEAQLDSIDNSPIVRWDEYPEVITEKQWTDIARRVGAILPSDWDETITQRQLISLRDNHRWDYPGVITEGQLDQQVSSNAVGNDETARWKAASGPDYHKHLLKAASDAVTDAMANYGVELAQFPQVLNIVKETPYSQLKTVYLSLVNSVPSKIALRAELLSRLDKFGGDINKEAPIDAVLASIADHMGYFKAEDFVDAMDFIVSNADVLKQAHANAQEKLAARNAQPSALDKPSMFRQAFDELNKSDDGAYKVCATVTDDLGLDANVIENDRNAFVTAAKHFALSQVPEDRAYVVSIDADKESGAFEAIVKTESALSDDEKQALAKIARQAKSNSDLKKKASSSAENSEASAADKEAARKDMIREAQMMGGQMGGQGDVSQAPGAGASLPQPPPGGEIPPVDTFNEPGGMDDFGDEGGDLTAKPPGTFCYVCTSEDVDVMGGSGKCNNCGSEWTTSVSIDIAKHKGIEGVGDEAGGEDEFGDEPEGEGFELPENDFSVPVAARTILRPEDLKKMAERGHKLGHISPVTGSTHTEKIGDNQFLCLASGQTYEVLAKGVKGDSSKVFVEWRWDSPTNKESCDSCRRVKKAFASSLKDVGVKEADFDRMSLKDRSNVILSMSKKRSFAAVKTARKDGSVLEDFKKVYAYKGDNFPIESCRERIGRMYGEDALAISGPCEGQKLYDCVCNQLKSANVYSDRLAVKLASVWSEADPTVECWEDRIRDGFTMKQACFVCSQLKNKYAQAVEMFADDLETDVVDDAGVDDLAVEEDPIVDPFEAVGDLNGADGVGETISVDIPLEVLEPLGDAIDAALGGDLGGELGGVEETTVVELDDDAAEEVGDAADEALDTVDDAVEEVVGPDEDATGFVEDSGEEEEVEAMDAGTPAPDLDSPTPVEMPPTTEVMTSAQTNNKEKEGKTAANSEENGTLEKVASTQEATEEDYMNEAQAFKPHRITGRDISLDVDGILKALGKEAGESTLTITPAQDDGDIAPISDGSTMGHEPSLDLDGPDVFTGNAEMQNEKNTDGLDSDEVLPTVSHGGSPMGHEGEVGLTPEKGDHATGGEDGQGNNRDASANVSTKEAQNRLADNLISLAGESKLEAPAPLEDDQDIATVQVNKDHSHTPEADKITPHESSDDVEVPERGDASHMGHEGDQGSVPKSPKDHPEYPVGGGMSEKYDKNEKNSPEKQTRDKGTVIARSDEENTDQRKEAAFELAGKMIEAGTLSASELNNKVDELMQYDIAQIRDLDKTMFSFAAKGLDAVQTGLEKPLLIHEASNEVRNEELSDVLQKMFKLDKFNKLAAEDENTELRRLAR